MTTAERVKREITRQRGELMSRVYSAISYQDKNGGDRAVREAFDRIVSVCERCDRCGESGDCPCP